MYGILPINFSIKYKMDLMSIHATTIYPASQLGDGNNGQIAKQWDSYAAGNLQINDLPLVYIPEGLQLRDLQKARKKLI